MNERDKELLKQADKFANENRTQNIAAPGNNYFELLQEKFADLIRADEREACAKFLERIDLGKLPPNMALHYGLLINSLVSGIRARGNT